jgi:nickel-dependent lactate racemase
MRLSLDYGREGLVADFPADRVVKVLSLQPTTPLPNVQVAVSEALENPIGTRPLSKLVTGKKTACIVICDITRPVPNQDILPPLIKTLAAHNVSTKILIATGTHRPNLGEEVCRLVGPEIASQIEIVNHVCTDAHPYLGESPNGVPISLNQIYLDADVKVTVGMIEPHFMAGFAGGRKMVMPGVAGLKTVQNWHSPRFLEHANATNGILLGNPVHEEALSIARAFPPDMIVDVALDPHKRPYAVFAGDMELAWNAGVELVREKVTDYVPLPVDVVVTTSGGYPLDLTFYQSVKGMVGALPILKEGGTIILASACDEGIGNQHFADTLLGLRSISDFLGKISDPNWVPIPDQWQVEELTKVCRHATVKMVCRGIPHEMLTRLHVQPSPSIEDALAGHPNGSIAVIPKGPYVLPKIG